jgi:hypothetical protein
MEAIIKTKAEIAEIINGRVPLGKFYAVETSPLLNTDLYIAVDNSTGEAWTEEFANLPCALKWLEGESGYAKLFNASDYDVPAFVLLDSENWIDNSFRNDACPSFEHYGLGLRLWVGDRDKKDCTSVYSLEYINSEGERLGSAYDTDILDDLRGWLSGVMIYKSDVTNWRFVEKWLPDYSSRDDIAENDDLQKIVDGEEGDEEEDSAAYSLLHEDYKGDREAARVALDMSTAQVTAEALTAYLNLEINELTDFFTKL